MATVLPRTPSSESRLRQPLQQRLEEYSNQYGDITITGNARVVLGNVSHHQDDRVSREHDEDTRLLLKALYYDSMNRRKNAILTASEATCDWIWTTPFHTWLHASTDNTFWICGKPGSGKSTLMKYLSQTSEHDYRLPTRSSGWIVTSFFFDFRLKGLIADSEEGLVRSLLIQLIGCLPGLSKDLKVSSSLIEGLAPRRLPVLLREALGIATTDLLIIVDGLDEYSGNIRLLLKFLLSLRDFSNVKLCLASRPDPMIREMLVALPQINMSDYNSKGITQYVDEAIAEFQPYLDMIQLEKLESVIRQRAEGVFLWVFFAVEEILQACAEGAVIEEIKEKLEILPTELEQIYQRILDRMPAGRRAEAAILFELVNRAGFDVSVELLHSAVYFSTQLFGFEQIIVDVKSLDHFSKRLSATMGGLLELSHDATQPEDATDFGSQSTYVRLIHQTVRSFTIRTNWTSKLLPTHFQNLLCDTVWPSFSSRVLEMMSGPQDVEEEHPRPASSVLEQIVSSAYGAHLSLREFSTLLDRLHSNESFVRCAALLHHAIRHVILYARSYSKTLDKDLVNGLLRAMRCRLSSMHYALVAAHCSSEYKLPAESLTDDMSDLMLAAGHRWYSYLEDRIQRIRDLRDRQRNDLAAALILSTRETGSACLAKQVGLMELHPGNVHDIVNMILECNTGYSSFHLAVFLSLGYERPPRFIMKLAVPARSIEWPLTQRPKWNIGNILDGPVFPREPPLFIWACDYNRYPQQARRFDIQLLTLLSVGVNIHSTSSTGQNIVQYLVETHFFGHFFGLEYDEDGCSPSGDFSDSINKLYLLEEAGADFEPSNGCRTPLQACTFYSAMLAPVPLGLGSKARVQCDQLQFMLVHKMSKGHLPRLWDRVHEPQPDSSLLMRCCLCDAHYANRTWQASHADNTQVLTTPVGTHSDQEQEVRALGQHVSDSQTNAWRNTTLLTVHAAQPKSREYRPMHIYDFLVGNEQRNTEVKIGSQVLTTWAPVHADPIPTFTGPTGDPTKFDENSPTSFNADDSDRSYSLNRRATLLHEQLSELGGPGIENEFKRLTFVDESTQEVRWKEEWQESEIDRP